MGIFTDVCVLSHQRDCVGVSEGAKEGQVICTYSSSVEVYNTQDHSLECSWPLGSSDRASCTAVHHASTSTYYVICNRTELVTWRGPESGGVGRKELNSSVHSLLAPRTLPYVVIVYSDGAIGTQDGDQSVKAIERRTRRTASSPVVLTSVLWASGGREAVLLVCSSGTLCICTLGETGPQTVTRHQLANTKLTQGCICGQTAILLDSEGTIHTFPLDVASPELKKMAAVTTAARQVVSVDASHFIVVTEGNRMSIWETVYGTCQGRLESGHDNITGLYCCGGVVCIVCEAGVGICSVHCPLGGIASALGRREVRGVASDSLLVAPKWLLPKQDIAVWREQVSEESQKVTEWLRVLLDPNETSTLESFTAQMELHPLPLGPALEAIVRRVLEEERFWGRDVLKKCLSSYSFTAGQLRRLVERCVTNKDWPLLVTCLESVDGGIPEDVIVQLLKVVVHLPVKVKAWGVKVRQNRLLTLVLTQPHNDAMMVGPLSTLPLPTVMSLLLFLSKRIKMEYLIDSAPSLPYDVVLDWIGVLLDTHSTQLMLAEESKQLLTRLNRNVNTQVMFLSKLSVLHGARHAASISSKDKMTEWLYKVDKLEIRI
ncbi:hypothetical protein EMCRGX_G012759 [Ephydatia muelleri]